MLRKKTLSVYMNMHEPWTIEPWHIQTNYRLAGVHVLHEDCIKLPETPITGPNMNLEGKDFVIHVVVSANTRNICILLPPERNFIFLIEFFR